jgi:hypothetical protein
MTSSTIVAVVALAGVVAVGAALPLVRRIVRRRTPPGHSASRDGEHTSSGTKIRMVE